MQTAMSSLVHQRTRIPGYVELHVVLGARHPEFKLASFRLLEIRSAPEWSNAVNNRSNVPLNAMKSTRISILKQLKRRCDYFTEIRSVVIWVNERDAIEFSYLMFALDVQLSLSR